LAGAAGLIAWLVAWRPGAPGVPAALRESAPHEHGDEGINDADRQALDRVLRERGSAP
jgi:hypothetical protein